MESERERLLREHEAHYGNRDILAWTDPRKVIAPNGERDDLTYGMAGALQASVILRVLNMPPRDLAKLSLIDVGCGTGKVTRVLRLFVNGADGYDPKPQCIEAARAEAARCAWQPTPPSYYNAIPDRTYDIIICTDVIPGLGMVGLAQLCGTFRELSKAGTRLVANVRNFREPIITCLLEQLGLRREAVMANADNLPALGMYSWARYA